MIEIKAEDIFAGTLARAAGPDRPPYDWWVVYEWDPLSGRDARTLLHCVDYAVMLRMAWEVNACLPNKSAFGKLWEHQSTNWKQEEYYGKRFEINLPEDSLVTRNR